MKRLIIQVVDIIKLLSVPFLYSAGMDFKFSGEAFAQASGACQMIEDFGGGTGVSDNASAVNSWFSSLNGNSGCLSFKPGQYTFATNPSAMTLVSGQTISISGSGQDVTRLLFNSGIGTAFSISYSQNNSAWSTGNVAHLSNITLLTNSTNSMTAYHINGNSIVGVANKTSHVENVAIRGNSGNQTWARGLVFQDTQDVSVDHYRFDGCWSPKICYLGIGIQYVGTSISKTPTQVTVHDMVSYYAAVGIDLSGEIEGLIVTGSNFVADDIGIAWRASSQRPQCTVSASEFDVKSTAVNLKNCTNSDISGNFIAIGRDCVATNQAIYVADSLNVFVHDNYIAKDGSCLIPQNGIIFASGAIYSQVHNNSMNGFATNIIMQAGSEKNKVLYNTIISGVPIADAGTGNIAVGN